MSLKIICGRAGCGKSTYMLKDMPENENSIYIVPEQFSFSAEKMLLDTFGYVGLGNPQVLSFMRLADSVFAKYGAPEFVADSASFEMLVSYCSNSIKPEKLRLFDGLVKKSELAQTASSIITTFKRYRISPAMLKSAIEKTQDALLRKKLSDSLTVYEEYLNELDHAGISDHNDILSVLADILSDEDCDFLENKHIYIDQFTDFDPSEYECIKVMMQRAQRVCVSLCTDGSAQFETVNRTHRALMSIARECNIPIEPEEQLENTMYNVSPMLRHLESFYFEDCVSKFCGNDGSISIFCGKNKFSEIHNAAREIVRLVRDKGLRYRDISIVTRDANLYKGIIERVFPFYDIPAFVDKKTPLSGHSVTMFITSILDIALGGFSYESVFSYAKSPFSPLTKEETDILENYCLAAGVRPLSWRNPFTKVTGAYSAENKMEKDSLSDKKLDEINLLREKIYTPLSTLTAKLRGNLTVNELTACLFDFYAEIGFEKKVRRLALRLEENGENLHALQTMQVYNILVDIFNDICAVLGDKKLTLREFYTTVMAGFQSVEIGTIPSSADCVTVGSIDRIKGHGAKVVFLVGANSGIFPAYPTESGLFTDDDKIALGDMGIEMPPNLLQKSQSEQLLTYDAITCASQSLYISYASADNSSNALMPSEIVERVQSLFPDISFSDDLISLPDDISIITTKKAVFDMLCSKIRSFTTQGVPLSDAMRAAAYYFSTDDTYAPLLKLATDMTYFTNAPSNISASLIEKSMGENMKTSITRLESYNKCPFSFFAKYLLKLEPKKTFEVNVSDSGSFLHDFLDMFSSLLSLSVDIDGNQLNWKTIDDDFIKTNTPIILQEILLGVNSHMLELPRIKALFDRLCKTALQAVYAVRQHIIKSDFIPMGYEISFDEDGTFKPTKITLADGKQILLRGRIDRADKLSIKMPDGTCGEFVRIIDYKSSDKSLSLSDVYHGVQLQLFVYLSNLCENGYSPAGILYCNLTDPIVSVNPDASEDEILKKRFDARRMGGIILSENGMLDHMGGNETLKTKQTATAKNFNSMFRHLNKVIKKTAENIYSGKFPIKCTDDACTWCEFSHLCRFDKSFSGCSIADNQKLKDEQVWELLEKEDAENEMD